MGPKWVQNEPKLAKFKNNPISFFFSSFESEANGSSTNDNFGRTGYSALAQNQSRPLWTKTETRKGQKRRPAQIYDSQKTGPARIGSQVIINYLI